MDGRTCVGCQRPAFARGWCLVHFRRNYGPPPGENPDVEALHGVDAGMWMGS